VTAEQLDLFEGQADSVDPTSRAYVRGFQAGFVARSGAHPPEGLSREERVGWVDGYRGVQVPEWRLSTYGDKGFPSTSGGVGGSKR